MRHRTTASIVLSLGTVLVVACGSQSRRSGFEETQQADAGPEASSGFTPGAVACAGLDCKRVACDNGVTTTLTGKVYDPAGANALYNVQVYIPGGTNPDGPLPPLSDSTVDGIKCETCSNVVLNPMVSALTNEKGEFTLENVPVDKDVPIVVQVGKWRRKLNVDIQEKCTENKAPDKTLKLPKNASEGDMPQIAVTTGGLDALECLLRGVGVDDSEFVEGHGGTGHVHLFQGDGGGLGTPAKDFWNDGEQLKKYDIVMFSCEGGENLDTKGGAEPGARASVYDYLNAGGRVFTTHYHYVWFKESPQDEFKQIAQWGTGGSGTSPFDVNMGFPKGEKLAQWLKETGASSTLGQIKLDGVTKSVEGLNEPAVAWISSGATPKYFSFNTPISSPPEEQCGRAVFSDVHVTDDSGPTSIGACAIGPGGLNAQQKAIEFLFFDLSSCVQDDKVPPTPPK